MALAHIRVCSRLEGLLLKKKTLKFGDSPEVHSQKVYYPFNLIMFLFSLTKGLVLSAWKCIMLLFCFICCHLSVKHLVNMWCTFVFWKSLGLVPQWVRFSDCTCFIPWVVYPVCREILILYVLFSNLEFIDFDIVMGLDI